MSASQTGCGCNHGNEGHANGSDRAPHGHDGHSHHGHSHCGHSHLGRGHHHGPANYTAAFAIGIGLNLGFVVLEAAYGFLSGSLALLSDAGHNLSDVLGLVLAWGALVLARRPTSARRTYGLRRSSILASLLNAMLLLVAVGGIVWEAVRRFNNPEPVAGKTVVIVATIGIVINTATALFFMAGSKDDLNIRGAFLHMAADAAVSAGVVVAGLLIGVTGWLWLDPVTSLLIAAVIVIGTWGLLRESLDLALDAVPENVDPLAVRAYLNEQSGVSDVHDLHIWAMSTTETALTAHVMRCPPATVNNGAIKSEISQGQETDDAFLARVADELRDQFSIAHTTLQIEHSTNPDCAQRDCNDIAPGNSES